MPTAASGTGPAWINPAYAPPGSPAGLQQPANAYPGWKPGMPSLQQINGGSTPIIPPGPQPTGLGLAAGNDTSSASSADFMTPAMQQYVDQFKASQANQQQAINAGLMQAMQGLGQRRDAAAQLVSSLPGQYGTIMNEANADQKNSAAVDARAKGAPVSPNSAAVLGANSQLISNANKQIGIAGKQGVPLLNMAVAADYSKGATTLNNTHMQNQAQLADRQQAFDSDMLKSQAAWQQQQEQSKVAQNNAFAMEQMREAHDQAMASADRAWKTDQNKAALANQPATDPTLAQAGVTQAEASTIKASKQYQELSGQLSRASAKDAQGQAAMITSWLADKNPTLLKILAAENPTVFKDAEKHMPGRAGGDGIGSLLGQTLGGTFSWQGPKTAWAGLTSGSNPYDSSFYRNNGAR